MRLFATLCLLLAIATTTLAVPSAPFVSSPPINSVLTQTNTLQTQAYTLYKAHHYAAAAKLFGKVLQQNTNDFTSAWRLGYCYYMLTNYEEATNVFAKYTKLAPDISTGHRWFGKCLLHLEKYPEAERELRAARRLNPTNAFISSDLGYSLQCQHRYLEAATEFQTAIKVGGETGYRCLHGGVSYSEAYDYRDALPLLERAVALETNNGSAYEWLAGAYYNLRDYNKAASTFRKAVEISPNEAYSQKWLGMSYKQAGKYDLARDALAKAAQLDPDDPETHESYASVLILGNRPAEAIQTLSRFESSTNRNVRLTLFTAYLMHRDYRKAADLYPVAFTIGVAALAIAFLVGSALLLLKSFRASTSEHPHVMFALSWLVLFFESQLALVFFAGLFTDARLIVGLLLAPLPPMIAAIAAFPRQPWGKPFTSPNGIPRKQIATAFIAWIGAILISGAYMQIVTLFVPHPPEPRNVRIVMEIVREHRLLAGIAVVLLAPIAEEILFRGLLFGALRKWLNPTWTIVTTAAIFAAVHLDPFFLVPLFALGLVLGWARHKTNSIWSSSAIHICQNALAFTTLLLQ